MAGVGAAVVADDEIVLVGEQIDDLALGLIAPLQADDTGAGHRGMYLFRGWPEVPFRGDIKNAWAAEATGRWMGVY